MNDINQTQQTAAAPLLASDSTITPEVDPQQTRLFTFSDAKVDLQQLHQKWAGEITETTRRRLLRNVDLSPKKLRDDGKLKADETIVPIRIIDTNIRREQPAYVNYLVAPQRTAIFTCLDDPQMDTQNLEREFTTVSRYIEWDTPHYKVLDGSQTHGWDSVEVVFDPSKPGHFALEHIGHENLFFSTEALHLDPCLQISRKYSVSRIQLDKFVTDYGFNKEQVDLMKQATESADKQDSNVIIYKRFFKYQGIVYSAWYSMEHCQDWLKAPAKHYVGIKHQETQTVMVPTQVPSLAGLQTVMQPQQTTTWVNTDLTQYPIFILPYAETEEQTIVSHKGRVFFDNFKQEAMTAIASGYVNGMMRASNIYGAVKTDQGKSSAPRQLDTTLVNGAIYDQPMDFFHTEYPDPSILTGLQYFQSQNAEETGQLAASVANRKDSRKTATEVQAASQQQAMLSTVQVALYSTFLRKVYSFVWLVVQSQALQGQIKFLQINQQQLAGGVGGQFQAVAVNDVAKISLQYLVKPSGDTDVLERDALVNSMRQDWPVISQTPLASEFLKELIKRRYPQQADKWIASLDTQVKLKQLVQNLVQVSQQLIDPNKLAAMTPQMQQQAQGLMQEVQQVLQPSQAISTPATEQS